jgi:hypothetical protein
MSSVRSLSLGLLFAAAVLGVSGCGNGGSAPQTGVLVVQVLGLPASPASTPSPPSRSSPASS